MSSNQFRIECDVPFRNRLLPAALWRAEYACWNVAVAVAAKCVTQPIGHEMRVVNRDSGEIVFRFNCRAAY